MTPRTPFPGARAAARAVSFWAVAFVLLASPAFAGGFQKGLDVTGFRPSPIPGHVIADLVPVRWDPRCIPVGFRVNDSQDPVPNPLGPPVLTVAAATPVLAQALSTWTGIRTSYLAFGLEGSTGNPDLPGFDFVNELTFRAPADFDGIALTLSFNLEADQTFADGDDLDGDGDSDVSSAIATCGDVDDDGDFELPAGSYEAGTLVDADVMFKTEVIRFTVGDANVDTNPLSVDLLAIATHETGHAAGLSHVLDNQISATDGTPTTMFPFVDTGDPADERALRSLGEDDVATLSLHYPEGTAASGPAAIQPGDLRFSHVYGRLRGTVTDGETGFPLAGASVSAESLATGRLAAAAFSGHTRLSVSPSGELFLIDEAFNIVDGDYEMALPLGIYQLRIEALDDLPVAADGVTFNELIGVLFGQHDFHEEGYSFPFEDAVEVSPGLATPVVAVPGLALGGHDITTNVQLDLGHFNALTAFRFANAQAGTYYAVRIPGSDLLGADQGDGVDVQTAEFLTAVTDSSVVSVFAEALLTTGTVSGTTATIDLAHPLRRVTGFVGQEQDFAPFHFLLPRLLGSQILHDLRRGDIANLFLVLRVPTSTPFPGVSGVPPLVGISTLLPIAKNSYTSTNGGVTFNRRDDLDFLFRLVVTPR